MMRKVVLFVIIFIVIFFIVSGKKIYENLAIQFSFDENIPEVRYNKALFLAKQGNFAQAKIMLPSHLSHHNAELFELSGDILFLLHESSGAILKEYEKSLEIQENPRIRKKIALLSEKKEQTTNSSNEDENFEEYAEIEQYRSQILEDQKQRELFLNPHGSSGDEFEKNLEYLKHILHSDAIIQKKDW